jgi:hypothetical protein
MFGFPTETIQDLEKTFDQACQSVAFNADIVFCFLSPIKGTKIHEQFEHLLTNKAQEHLHDFTDTRANYLFGTKDLLKNHPCFKDQAKMFSNGKAYDAVVKKIRELDSVHIFTHLNQYLLALKQRFNIDIYESKMALKTFPYSQDLFEFAVKKAKKNSIPLQALAAALYDALQKQAGVHSNHQFEEITICVLLDRLIQTNNIPLPQWGNFKENICAQFFKKFSIANIYPELLTLENFQLCAAFKMPSIKTLFMKFIDPVSLAPVLTGITLDQYQNRTLVYYKEQVNDKEICLLKSLEQIIAGGIHA